METASEFTRLHPFFENLRKGRLTTTRCSGCGDVPQQRYVGGDWGLCHNLSGNANDHAVMVLHRGG